MLSKFCSNVQVRHMLKLKTVLKEQLKREHDKASNEIIQFQNTKLSPSKPLQFDRKDKHRYMHVT